MKKILNIQDPNHQQEQAEQQHQVSHQQAHNQQHIENNIEQSQPIEQENQQANQQQDEYDQYGLYDQEGGQMDMLEECLQSMGYRISSESNTQCEMEELVKIIDKETIKVMELSGFDEDWALIYYQKCGWKMNLVSTFIDVKLTSHSMIHYKAGKASISSLDGTCDVCCLDHQIIYQNMCGDQFCQDCWRSHLTEKLKTFNTEPFPPCLNSECRVKTSPFILEETSKNDLQFKRLYLRTLCRSYAIGNTSVKMCKGREKFSCDRCFKVNKLFEVIECQCCENVVCGRCGEEYHFPSECFDGPNWRKIVEESTSFIENLNYRICPSCGEAVQRSIGCNSMVCKCKETFCYTCGQKWLPNHTQHGFCYKQMQVKALRVQKKRKQQNQKDYTDRLEKFKAEVQKYKDKIKHLEDLDVQEAKSQLIVKFKILSNDLDYLVQLRKKTRIALRMAKGYVLTLYFNKSEATKAEFSTLVQLIEQAYDYMIYTLNDLLHASQEVGVISKGSIVMRKQIAENKLIPQEFLAKQRIKMLGVLNGMEKYMKN